MGFRAGWRCSWRPIRWRPNQVGALQVILATLGSIGDLMPFLVVAERLRARGHRCIIASNAGYAQLVQASGFPFAAIWERGTQTLDDALAHDPVGAWAQVRSQ